MYTLLPLLLPLLTWALLLPLLLLLLLLSGYQVHIHSTTRRVPHISPTSMPSASHRPQVSLGWCTTHANMSAPCRPRPGPRCAGGFPPPQRPLQRPLQPPRTYTSSTSTPSAGRSSEVPLGSCTTHVHGCSTSSSTLSCSTVVMILAAWSADMAERALDT